MQYFLRLLTVYLVLIIFIKYCYDHFSYLIYKSILIVTKYTFQLFITYKNCTKIRTIEVFLLLIFYFEIFIYKIPHNLNLDKKKDTTKFKDPNI